MKTHNLLRLCLVIAVALSLSFTSTIHADELPCDTIIAPENWHNPSSDIETTSIEDCANPFGATTEVESPYTLKIDNEPVAPNSTVMIAESGTNQYELEGDPVFDSTSFWLFLHDGDDYRYVNTQPSEPTESDYRAFALSYLPLETDIELYVTAMETGDFPLEEFDESLFWELSDAFYGQFVYEPVRLLPGTYTMVIRDEVLTYSRAPLFERLASIFIPTAHASEVSEYIFTITFTLTAELEEEPLDPLLLEYLPILRMHENEDYLPMNVEAFVGGSALWDDAGIFPDELVRAYDPEDPITIDDLASYDESDDLYLAFSDPENAKSLNVDAALTKYEALVDEGTAQTTVYARKMEDSYEDSFGEEHEFIVLQYWYFYAMNDWAEKGGLNNHEGDWESVFVFLDKDSEEPKYVAFSAHHNDGDSGFNPFQYGSVRREWMDDDIEREDTSVMSYVALGSHANYPKSGNHIANRFGDIDQALGSGRLIQTSDFENQVEINEAEPDWVGYEGKWGADRFVEGDDGPQGPYFIDVSGYLRYHDPIEWAGIDKIEEVVTEEPATWFSFPGTGIELNFGALIPEGTFFSTSPYFELPKGIAPSGTQLLSPFWDIESDLENGTFNTEIRLPINPESLPEIGGSANLNAYWFNPDTDTWEKQESAVDETGNFVVFNTNHFSRYAIGIEEPPETPVIEEEETETETTSSKSTGTRVGNRDPLPQVKGAQTSAHGAVISDSELATYETLITLLQQVIVMYQAKGYLTPSEMQSTINQLSQVLLSL